MAGASDFLFLVDLTLTRRIPGQYCTALRSVALGLV